MTFLDFVVQSQSDLYRKADEEVSTIKMVAAESLYITMHQMSIVADFTKDSVNGWNEKFAYQALVLMLNAQEEEKKVAFVKKCWTKYRSKYM